MPDPLGTFEYTWRLWLAAPAAGYLLGSIPFGLILCRIAGHGDIRNIGSGNIGATNVLRTGNKALAVITLLLDAGKAGALVAIADHLYGQDFAVISGLGAMVGHIHPLWLKNVKGRGTVTTIAIFVSLFCGFAMISDGGYSFRTAAGIILIIATTPFAWGGKGVACAMGCLIALAWPVGLLSCVSWLVVAVLFRFSSLAALSSFLLSVAYAYVLADQQITEFAVLLSVLICIRHIDNIRRLLKGREGKLSLTLSRD
tara:strand:+ start:1775 stop:2542 length:768 start_codon:yes stop_codon:yes gene_type:complete